MKSFVRRPLTTQTTPEASCPFYEGIKMTKTKSYTKALELFNQALISCDGTNSQMFLDIYEKRSSLLFLTGNFAAVIEDCSFILHVTPDNIAILTRRMQSHEKMGNIYEACQGKNVQFLFGFVLDYLFS
jgi:hypothetical protein